MATLTPRTRAISAGALMHLACGLLFGTGLWLSGMTDQRKILGFLDVTGDWDPTLAFVMAGALTVAFVGFRFTLKRGVPLRATMFLLPTQTKVDARLLGGSALFGVGWGLSGYCPGPALAALEPGSLPTLVFVACMTLGLFVVRGR